MSKSLAKLQSWMLWVAGILAVLGSIGMASLPLQVLFLQANYDEVMPNQAGDDLTGAAGKSDGDLLKLLADGRKAMPAFGKSLSKDEMEVVVRRLLTIRGIHNYAPRHLASAIRFLANHGNRFPFGEMVSSWFDLADHAMALAEASRPGAGRVGFRMG